MNNMNKNILLNRLKHYSEINQKAVKILNEKIAEYKAERANKHYWHSKMGVILNKFIANKDSHEKALYFFQKQISDLESGKKGTYLILQELNDKYKSKFSEIDGGVL